MIIMRRPYPTLTLCLTFALLITLKQKLPAQNASAEDYVDAMPEIPEKSESTTKPVKPKPTPKPKTTPKPQKKPKPAPKPKKNKPSTKKTKPKIRRSSYRRHTATSSSFSAVPFRHKALPETNRIFGRYWGRKRPAPSDLISIVQAQIYLDEMDYSPGIIDAQIGYFSKQALKNFNSNFSLDPDDWQLVLKEATRIFSQPFTRYRISGNEKRFIVSKLPYDLKAQGSWDYLGYRNMLELLAERFHCTPALLKKINPRINFYALQTGDIITVPKVTPFKIEAIQRDKFFQSASYLNHRQVVVDTKEKILRIYDNQQIIAAFPITPGKEKFIPYGSWKIKIMLTTPTFRYDTQMLQQGKRSDNYTMLPRGPNSPVGIFWAGITKSGIGLHGTSNPETIGRSRSAGCIRLTNWDAVQLPLYIRPGVGVVVK